MHEWSILVISSGARDLAFFSYMRRKISRPGLEMTIGDTVSFLRGPEGEG